MPGLAHSHAEIAPEFSFHVFPFQALMPASFRSPSAAEDSPRPAPLAPEDYDVLDDILEDLRARNPNVPQWEFCEGFMAALVCCRRTIHPAEYWPVLLDAGDDLATLFTDAAQLERFSALWQQRWDGIAVALSIEVESLDDERAYCPEVIDVRGAIAALPESERAEALSHDDGQAADTSDLPAFGQVWALGFMFAVESWPDEWVVPSRDKEAKRWIDESMEAIAVLCEDDTGPAEVSAFETDAGEGPPSMSNARLQAFGEAVWAVYDLRELWRSIGPRVETVRRAAEPGRNDLCHCGSGKKYKKCHGAN
jgi:uncharacterized protein